MPTTNPLPALHPLEAKAWGALWELGEATVREVMDALNRMRALHSDYAERVPAALAQNRISARGVLALIAAVVFAVKAGRADGSAAPLAITFAFIVQLI